MTAGDEGHGKILTFPASGKDLKRWFPEHGALGWIIRDSWKPDDFCMGFKNEKDARAEASWRNNEDQTDDEN
jgi:hypothetical protein